MDAYFEAILQTPVLVTLLALALLSYWIGQASAGGGVSEEQDRAEIATATAKLTSQQKMQIDAAVDAGKKVRAVHLYRDATGLGLKQSKQAVDARTRERHLTGRG